MFAETRQRFFSLAVKKTTAGTSYAAVFFLTCRRFGFSPKHGSVFFSLAVKKTTAGTSYATVFFF